MSISLVLAFILYFKSSNADIDKIQIRNLYEQASSSEAAFKKLNNLLAEASEKNAYLSGYKGAGIMIGANYTFSPLSKLNKFKTGKKLIEQALVTEPNNIEIRYVRLTLQTNLPKFLGYNNAIKRDKEFLIKQLEFVNDKDLRQRIVTYLLSSNICTAMEVKEVTVWKNK